MKETEIAFKHFTVQVKHEDIHISRWSQPFVVGKLHSNTKEKELQ